MVGTFVDPDAYFAAIRANTTEGIVTAPGGFRGELVRVDLARVWMQHGSENAATVVKFASSPDRTAFFFAADPHQPHMHLTGLEFGPHDVVTWGLPLPRHLRTAAGAQWRSTTAPTPDLVKAGAALAGGDFIPPSRAHCIGAPPEVLSRLRDLHVSATQLAKTAPDILTRSEVAHALDQAMVEAMVGCLVAGEAKPASRSQQHHMGVVRRMEAFMEEHSDRNIYLAELCAATGVSERVLLACCREHLGMSPKRYLVLRRMHAARRALLLADPETATVTDIATRFGFWELGRFSVAYRSFFGEMPSTSLRREPDDRSLGESEPSRWHLSETA